MARINKDHIWLFYEHGVELSTKTYYLGAGDKPDEELDSGLTASAIKSLHVLSSIRPDEPIRVIINNLGGDVHHGLALYDFIRSLSSPVHMDVFGTCHSIAAWILQAADWRRMSKHSVLMIHEGTSGLPSGVSRESLENWMDFYKKQDGVLHGLLRQRLESKRPGITQAQVRKLLQHDRLYTADEALAAGLIDEIIQGD